MSLETVDPPIAAYEAVRSRLVNLATTSGFGTPAMRRAPPDALALSTPHRVAVLPANRIQPKMALRQAASLKGWRFLILNGKNVIATADTISNEKGEQRFAQINEGPFVQGTEQVIRRAEEDELIRKGRFEPVFLMVPTLMVVALWLRDLDGDADRLMVIPPAPKELRSFAPLATNDFVAVLNDLAKRDAAAKE
jgi:hypothetical protein